MRHLNEYQHHLRVDVYKRQTLRRVEIPKKNGKKRPLGIPTMKDRAMQALYLMAHDPIAETTGDQHSYGCLLYTSPLLIFATISSFLPFPFDKVGFFKLVGKPVSYTHL